MAGKPAVLNHCPSRMSAMAAVLILVVLFPLRAFAQCELAPSANAAMVALATEDTTNINNYISQEESFIEKDLSQTATYEMKARLQEFDTNIRNWLLNWWDQRLKPSMKNGTKQLSVAQVQQTFSFGAMLDGQLLNETIKKKEDLKNEARARYLPSETSCQTASVGAGQTKAYSMSRKLTRGLTKDISKRSGNAKGSSSATGRGSEIKEHWDEYVAKFCDNTKGDLGCDTPGTVAGKHKDLPSLLWSDKQTINLKDFPDNVIMVRAALRYLVAPASPDPIPPGSINSNPGRQALLDRRAGLARSNAVLNAVGQMLSERVGVKQESGINNTFRLMRRLSGVKDEDISDDPSYSEIRDAVTKDRFLNPQYLANIIVNPQEAVREQSAINASRLQLMSDLYHRSEEMLFMEAAAYSHELDKQKPGSAVGSAPTTKPSP